MQLSRVGRILEHALHKKFLTLGEVLSVHTNFQTLLITPAIEWSHSTDLGVSAPPPNRDGNFAPPRPAPLDPPFPASSRADFSRPAKVMGRGWGKILDPHHGTGRGWVYTF